MNQANNITDLIIYGCGGHARSVADVALYNGIKNLIFIDANARSKEQIFGFAILAKLPHNGMDLNNNYIVAIGDNRTRYKIFSELKSQQKTFTRIISKDAYLGINHLFGVGVFVGHNAHVGPNTIIGENTIINTHCLIEHDCLIGKHCHIAVNATVTGKCALGDFITVGAGATIIDGITVCSNVTIGAGAVVIRDIEKAGTYVGVPARQCSDKA